MGNRFLECERCRTRYGSPSYAAGQVCFCGGMLGPVPPPVLTDEEIDEAAFHAAVLVFGRDHAESRRRAAYAVRTPQGNIRLEW